MRVQVAAPDPGWQAAFRSERELILGALADTAVEIHHIGSTAIPGIYAKPIIDMLVEVNQLDAIDRKSAAMEALGYQAIGEYGIPGRRYFRKSDSAGVRTHHVHAFVHGSLEAERHLAFRDYMAAQPEEASRYSELKRKLARKHPEDLEAYLNGKDAFMREIDRRAARWRDAGSARP